MIEVMRNALTFFVDNKYPIQLSVGLAITLEPLSSFQLILRVRHGSLCFCKVAPVPSFLGDCSIPSQHSDIRTDEGCFSRFVATCMNPTRRLLFASVAWCRDTGTKDISVIHERSGTGQYRNAYTAWVNLLCAELDIATSIAMLSPFFLGWSSLHANSIRASSAEQKAPRLSDSSCKLFFDILRA